jgi:hypothetical protein
MSAAWQPVHDEEFDIGLYGAVRAGIITPCPIPGVGEMYYELTENGKVRARALARERGLDLDALSDAETLALAVDV